ncbi:hypothetical protein BRYFOR_09935 [Marvinbryantia formatexigens DSM 14469]|uniref:Uncharacterized protein n=2 Tax=Marvinbryantia TaxID=248744 RepID=C6LMN4_9FIRM|nr:hypothetical protein [Marvinbryantia formatexigens]EET58117.1 hypothetical protein BRYFOR_09935 [Marvinbryantia formatexigens DSM 14469]UWO25652.1 hypothetical protein NQ534_04005 [Marvinbryantia formatexigens DSM 14469]
MVEKMTEGYRSMKIGEVKIYPCFAENPPRTGKYEEKSWQYARNGLAESDIVLDSQGYLIDGYCWYLLALEHELTHVPVRYGKQQIIRAYHRKSGRLYTWRLLEALNDCAAAGDRAVVHTRQGVRTVTVAEVGEYRPEEYKEPLRTVIRVKKKQI